MPEDQRNVPQGSLELDRLRLEADIENRRAELELKRDELQVKKSELKRGLWSTPFVIAVIGAAVALFGTALGLIGNAVVAGVNGYWSSHVEAEKDRSNLILEAIRTNGDQKAVIGNLTLLAKAKLLGDDEVQKNILALANDPTYQIGLPSTVIAPTAIAPVQLRGPVFDAPYDLESRAQCLVQSGITYVARYFSIHKAKVMTREEALALSGAGLQLISVYEDGNDPSKFNHDLGDFQAKQALAQAKDIEQPPGSTIYFAIDFDPNKDIINGHVVLYFEAVKSTLQSDPSNSYNVGVYGSGLVLDELSKRNLVTAGWLHLASSFRGYQDVINSGN